MARCGKDNGRYNSGLSGTNGLYNSWQGMKQRSLNPHHPKYHRYGGRGVKVCSDWIEITGFIKWALANGYETGKTIDRIDNDGDYCPENCQWITASENSRKKRTTKIDYDEAQKIRTRLNSGESAVDLAKEYGVVHGTIWFIQNGFTHVPAGECTRALKNRFMTNHVAF